MSEDMWRLTDYTRRMNRLIKRKFICFSILGKTNPKQNSNGRTDVPFLTLSEMQICYNLKEQNTPELFLTQCERGIS